MDVIDGHSEHDEEVEDDVSMLDEDCEVLYEPGGIAENVSDDLLSPLDEAMRRGDGRAEGENLIWETFQELLLTLLDSGARTSKGALHALAPHCLRPFMGLTPELIQGT